MPASLSTAKARVRSGWKSVAIMVLLGGAALGVLFMTQSYAGGGGAGLSLPPIPPVGDVLRWTSNHREANVLRGQALGDVLNLLLGVGWVVLASALVTIVTRAAGQTAIRRGEVAVRRAVGASRGVLRLALLIEVGAIALVMLAVGLAIGFEATQAGFANWPGAGSPSFAPRVAFLLVALIVVMGMVLLIGANLRENIAHQEAGQVPLALPAGQLGFGLAILVGASLILGRANQVTAVPSAPLSGSGSMIGLELADPTAADRSARYRVMLDTLAADPSIGIVSLTNAGANSGLGVVDLVTTDCGQCPDGTIILKYHSFDALHEFVSPDTFEAQGIELLQGRGFTPDDDWNAPRVAVVSRHMAYRHFEGGNPIGRDLFVASGWPALPYRVIGVVADHPSYGLGGGEQPLSTVYLSVLQHPPAASELLIRPTSGSRIPEPVAARVVRILGPHASGGPAVPEAVLARQDAGPIRWLARRFGIAGWVLLLIAVVGAFAILHLWVRSRAAELVLRRSVGATRFQLVLFVINRTMVVAVTGVGLGLLLFATIVRPSLQDLFTDLPVGNPHLVFGLSLLLVMAGFAGSLVPTWRFLKKSFQ